MNGKVYLVGAGPGDWQLLTLRGRNLLEKADVIVSDHLASPRLLSFARAEAEQIYVGKRADHHTLPQEAINDLLIEKAREGKMVVRLKGGDPFVFGRGGEECTALKAAGIPYEVVPGVSSALAVPAYAGIPVTDRRCASSFAVITGHEKPDKAESSIHWDKLATAVDTLIFLMGVKNLPQITAKLQQYGRQPDTPCALIRWGTLGMQRTLTGTLAAIASLARQENFRPPAVFIVGDVVRCRKSLAWFEQKPLWGLRIAVTRSHHQASRLSNLLEEYGAYPIELPTIKLTEPDDGYAALDDAILHLRQYTWLVFASHNGVQRFFQRLHLQQLDTRALGQLKIAAIGSATAAHLEKYGITADLIPVTYRSEALVQALLPRLTSNDRVLLVHSQSARPVLDDALQRKRIPYTAAAAYAPVPALENRERLSKLLKNRELDYITLTSASTVTSLLTVLGPDKMLLKNTALACIGPVTAAACIRNGFPPALVADTYTLQGMVDKLIEGRLKKC